MFLTLSNVNHINHVFSLYLILKCHFFFHNFISTAKRMWNKWKNWNYISLFLFIRISNRFRIRTGKLRFYVGSGFDNCHIASQRHPRYSCQGFSIYWDVAEYRRTDTSDIRLGRCSWSILHSIAINFEGNYSIHSITRNVLREIIKILPQRDVNV